MNLRINSTSNIFRIIVNGSVKFMIGNDGTTYSSSDKRLKKNIKRIENN